MDRILILTNTSGGLYLFRQELLTRLMETAEVRVLTSDTGRLEQLRELGCRVTTLEIDRRGTDPRRDLALLRRYVQEIRSWKPDLVISYTIKPNIYGGLACRLTGTAYAANVTGLGTAFDRGGILRSAVTAMYRNALKRARCVFFENSADEHVFLQQRIVSPEKSCVLAGAGVNLERFPLEPYRDERTFRFLFMGRVMREKGVDELFSAMRRLAADGAGCELWILGGQEEDYRRVLRQYSSEGWLRYFGFQQDVRPFIRQCQCFVLPSWHEGMANTNLECAASGLPVITSDIPGCREAVIDGVSGYLCAPRDEESLYQAMKRILSLSAAQRESMGLAGRAHMEKTFDKTHVVEKTVERLFVQGVSSIR